MVNEINCGHKIEYYFLRISAERFSSDLSEFSKEIRTFSDEQLYGVVSYSSNIEKNIANVRKELERRLEGK
jgi:hypothetical protein